MNIKYATNEAGKLIAFVDGVDFIIYSFYNYFIKRVQRGT